MQLTKLIDLSNVEALSQSLTREKASRERFSIEVPVRDLANGIYAAMKVEVEHRGGKMVADEDSLNHIRSAAEWLSNPRGTFGLLFCGLYGNGKTTLAQAMGNLIRFLTERERGFSHRLQPRFVTSKEVCQLCAASERFKDAHEDYASLADEPLLIIDELGEEPTEVLVYGMIHTPIIDLLSIRYARQRMTIITTNLQTPEIEAKYGKRIYDRFTEMLTPIVFENDSYRPHSRGDDMADPRPEGNSPHP